MSDQISKIAETLRDVNRLKRKLTFGNMPAFYHSVATSLGMAEGMLKYGFENSLDTLTNKKNWNLKLLGGSENASGEIICDNKPRISVYKLFTHHGYEIHCIPWRGNQEFDHDTNNHPDVDFKFWRPNIMKVVFRIAQLHTFIMMYCEHGDEADLQLIRCAHNLAEDFIDNLVPQFDVQKVHGITVKSFFDFAEKRYKAGEEVYLPPVYSF
jgi:hypothetical protein